MRIRLPLTLPVRALRLLLSLSLAYTAVACVSAPALALTKRQIFGIGDVKDPAAFRDPHLRALRPQAARMIADWNVARTPGEERDRLDAWYQGALDAHLKPLLTFQGVKTSQVPSVAEYTSAFGAALRRWPRIREWQAWNEANHVGESVTFKHPSRAAGFAKAMERRCPRCTIVPLTYVVSNSRQSRRWLRAFLRAYGRTPRIWALHTYGDANHFEYRLLERFLRVHPKGRVWITETGGLAKFSHYLPYDLKRQRRATRVAFEEALHFRSRVDRMYYWQWYGAVQPRKVRWDSGLVTYDGKLRPAYREAKKMRFKRR